MLLIEGPEASDILLWGPQDYLHRWENFSVACSFELAVADAAIAADVAEITAAVAYSHSFWSLY